MLAAVFFAFAGPALPALAVTNGGPTTATSYVAAFAPLFGLSGIPRTGTMRLVIEDGTISGTYTGTSVGPDPLDNRIVAVTGSVSQNDGYLQLYIGRALSLRGTIREDGSISGTADYRGRLYEFLAKPA